MWIKIQAYTPEGGHVPGEIIDVREATALEWIKNRWAVARPDLETKGKAVEEPPVEEEPEQEEPRIERAVIETPEDHSSATVRETGTFKRKKK